MSKTLTKMDATNIYPIGRAFPNLPNEGPELRRWWLLRVTDRVGITMATLNDKNPNGWSINPATITLTLVVAGLIAGGSYYMGQRDNDAKHMMDRLEQAEIDAKKAKDLSIAAASQAGHPTPTPEVKKK